MLALLALFARPALACSCEGPTVSEERAESDTVFLGEASAVWRLPGGLVWGWFDVETVYKGDPAAHTMVRFWNLGCSSVPVDGLSMVVFSRDGVETNPCGNGAVEGAFTHHERIVAELSPGHAPTHSGLRPHWLLLVLPLVLGVWGLGWVIWEQLRGSPWGRRR